MNIDNRSKIFITISIFLLIGLVIAIFLSFQVMQDTKSATPSEVILPKNEKEPGRQTSIYDVEVPSFSASQEASVLKQEENQIIEKKKGKATVSKVKTLEQEQAELSSGLQDVSKSGVSVSPSVNAGQPTVSSSGNQTGAAPEIKVNQLNEEQIRDMQKKGIIIF